MLATCKLILRISEWEGRLAVISVNRSEFDKESLLTLSLKVSMLAGGLDACKFDGQLFFTFFDV